MREINCNYSCTQTFKSPMKTNDLASNVFAIFMSTMKWQIIWKRLTGRILNWTQIGGVKFKKVHSRITLWINEIGENIEDNSFSIVVFFDSGSRCENEAKGKISIGMIAENFIIIWLCVRCYSNKCGLYSTQCNGDDFQKSKGPKSNISAAIAPYRTEVNFVKKK